MSSEELLATAWLVPLLAAAAACVGGVLVAACCGRKASAADAAAAAPASNAPAGAAGDMLEPPPSGPQGRHKKEWRDTTAIFNHFDNLHFGSWLAGAHDRTLDKAGADPQTKEERMRAANAAASAGGAYDPHYEQYDAGYYEDGGGQGQWSTLSDAENAALQRGSGLN